MMTSKLLYDSLLGHFPKSSLRMAFAYGSGVFRQSGNADMKKNMIDLIFVVDDSLQWHQENIKQNPRHYSFLKYGGANAIDWEQNNFKSYVYFNTLVKCEDRTIKYGVISDFALKLDLKDWECLYTSGRLQKPVMMLHSDTDNSFELALRMNLENAVHTAMLLLPDEFSEEELYETLTSLSYTGDLRMTYGEDKNKIKSIVKPNMERFRELYRPMLEKEEHITWLESQGKIQQSLCVASRIHHLNLLPKNLTEVLVEHYNADQRNRDTEEIFRALAHDCQCRNLVRDSVSKIVKSSSTIQSVKGFFTAGFRKSLKYSLNKIAKMKRSEALAQQKLPERKS